MGSPVIFGANDITTGLQNGFLMADGTLFKSNGPKNYVTYGTFENNLTTGWSLGTIGTRTNGLPTGTPTFGSGANANLSIATTSSGKLANNYSLSLASSSATTAGNMLATQAYTIDIADQAKVLQIRFAYSMTVNNGGNFSGTSSNTLAWAVWDVTNSVWLTSAGNFNVVQSSGVGICSGTVQTGATTSQIRLCLYFPAATSGASTWLIDEVFVGPQISSMGPAMNDFISYTPTVTNLGTGSTSAAAGKYRRVGDTVQIEFSITKDASGGSGAGVVTISLPSGLSVDTSKISSGTNGFVGTAQTTNTTVAANSVITSYNSTYNGIIFTYTGTTNATGADFTANSVWRGVLFLPIVGWSSNTVQSSDTDTRVIAASLKTLSSTTITAGTAFKWTTTTYDTAGGYNASTGGYTALVTGIYNFRVVGIATTATAGDIDLYKNGVSFMAAIGTYNNAFRTETIAQVSLNAGDVVTFVPTVSATAGSTTAYLFVDRLTGPAVVQATETVAASYWVSANFAASTTVPINYDSKDYDTHNAVTTSATAWKFTAPVSGFYAITGNGYTATAGAGAVLYKNGAAYKGAGAIAPAATQVGTVAASIRLNAGDYIDIRPTGAVTVNGGSLATFSTNNITIFLMK